MSKIGVGIIGCGTIADVYMTNITQHYENVELLAVADMFVEKAQQAAEKFGSRRAAADAGDSDRPGSHDPGCALQCE